MTSSARKGVATRELLRQVAARATGRLSSNTVDGPLELYLMNGDLVGAVSPLDDTMLLRRVRLADAVSPEKLATLTRLASAGQSLFGPLIDTVPTEVIEPALSDRFRENVVQWVLLEDTPTFESLPGVFVDNMQMGHNTPQLVESACKMADRARVYPLDTEVVRGEGGSSDPLEVSILALTSNHSTPIEDLLDRVPGEPLTTRATFARLLDTGLLLEGGVELQELMTDEVELLRQDVIEPDDEDEDDAPTVRAVNELLDLEEDDSGEQSWTETAAPEDGPEDDDEDDADAAPVSPGNDLSKWLHTGDLDDEDMAFFEDYEDDRGGGQGAFSTESHNLDKVEVTDANDELLEADEAPASRFAAPVLGENVAVDKVAVCNEVLAKVASTFDDEQGAGRGQAVVQLLVDGTPSKYTAVLHGLAIQPDGQMPVEQILDNLSTRPATEHRQLLNTALKDLMERALSSAADELSDDGFDELYESVAGYNQRLGL